MVDPDATVIGIEHDFTACQTGMAARHLRLCADVSTYPPRAFRSVEGLIASPPCPAFSSAGKREGWQDIPRLLAHARRCRDGWVDFTPPEPMGHRESRLVLEVLRWTWELKPRWIACEQVKEVLPFWRACAETFQAWGYMTWAGILNSADYGVPQTRRRAFLMASIDRQPVPPPPTHCDGRPGDSLFGLEPWVTMAEALGWGVVDGRLERYSPGASRQGGPSPLDGGGGGLAASTGALSPKAGGLVVDDGRPSNERFKRSTEFSADRPSRVVTSQTRSWTVRTGRDSSTSGGGLVRYARDIDLPAPTLDTKVNRWAVLPGWPEKRPATTVAGDPRISPPGYRGRKTDYDAEGNYIGKRSMDDAIKVTLEEAAILQGFDPEYPFQGSRTKQFEQVGNAVPPPFAAAVLRMLA